MVVAGKPARSAMAHAAARRRLWLRRGPARYEACGHWLAPPSAAAEPWSCQEVSAFVLRLCCQIFSDLALVTVRRRGCPCAKAPGLRCASALHVLAVKVPFGGRPRIPFCQVESPLVPCVSRVTGACVARADLGQAAAVGSAGGGVCGVGADFPAPGRWTRRRSGAGGRHRGHPAVWTPGDMLVIDQGVQRGLQVSCAVLALSRSAAKADVAVGQYRPN
jgi:hypothetical protein